MYNQIYNYKSQYLSHYLCGFRKGYSAQHCSVIMLEWRKKVLDKKKIDCALLKELSKAFG